MDDNIHNYFQNHDDHSYCKKKRNNLVLKGNKVAQEMLANAFNFFETKFPEFNAFDITAECLGISRPTVELYKNGPTEMSIQPLKRKRTKPLTDDIPETLRMEIRRIVCDMHTEKKIVSLSSLKKELDKRMLYNGSIVSLSRLLKKMGLYYKRDGLRRTTVHAKGTRK